MQIYRISTGVLCSSPVWKGAPVHQHLLVLPHDRTKPLLCNHRFSLAPTSTYLFKNNSVRETRFSDLLNEHMHRSIKHFHTTITIMAQFLSHFWSLRWTSLGDVERIYLRLVVAERGKCGGWPLTCPQWWSPEEERWRRQWNQSPHIYIPEKPFDWLVRSSPGVSWWCLWAYWPVSARYPVTKRQSVWSNSYSAKETRQNQKWFMEKYSLIWRINDQINNRVSLMCSSDGTWTRFFSTFRNISTFLSIREGFWRSNLRLTGERREALKWSFKHPWSQLQKNNLNHQDNVRANIRREHGFRNVWKRKTPTHQPCSLLNL